MGECGAFHAHHRGQLALIAERAALEGHQHEPGRARSAHGFERRIEGTVDIAGYVGQQHADWRATVVLAHGKSVPERDTSKGLTSKR
jgi:hypothetical protein